MANFKDLKDEKSKKSGIIIGAAIVAVICIFAVGALIHYDGEENKKEKTQYNGVHVKGAVENSGYYEVPLGTRVRDLEKYVGGFDENAFLDGINLAAYVKDGEEIIIPYKGLPENGALNLNTVTEEELVTLVDGIGETSARKIVDYRTSHGGFVSVLELDEILGKSAAQKLYDDFYVK